MNCANLSDEQLDLQASLIANSCNHVKCASPHCITTISISTTSGEDDKYCRACQSERKRRKIKSAGGQKEERQVLRLNRKQSHIGNGNQQTKKPGSAHDSSARVRPVANSAVDAFEYLANLASKEEGEGAKFDVEQHNDDKPVLKKGKGRGYLSLRLKRRKKEAAQDAA